MLQSANYDNVAVDTTRQTEGNPLCVGLCLCGLCDSVPPADLGKIIGQDTLEVPPDEAESSVVPSTMDQSTETRASTAEQGLSTLSSSQESRIMWDEPNLPFLPTSIF